MYENDRNDVAFKTYPFLYYLFTNNSTYMKRYIAKNSS